MKNFLQMELIERRDLTEDLAVFRFRPEQPVEFIPGQYMTVGVEKEGKKILRPYSILSSPLEPEIELLIELVPQGQLTPFLWTLKPGTRLWYRPRILGKLVLQEDPDRDHHLMVATVTGVAPYLSIIRTFHYRLQRGESVVPPRICILHGASYARELGFLAEELQGYDQQYEWFTYVPTISRPGENPDWQGEIGRVEDVLRKWADTLGFTADKSIAYACGHPGMIQNVKEILQRARFERQQIKEERYFTIPRAKGGADAGAASGGA